MIKIKRNKYIAKINTLLVLFAIILFSPLLYFFGWDFEIETFIIFLIIMMSMIIFSVTIYFIIMKNTKTYYIITDKEIKKYRNDVELFTFKKNDIISLHYIDTKRMLLAQLGAGYLHFKYTDRNFDEGQKIRPSITYLDKHKYYSISMSSSKAREISRLINKEIYKNDFRMY